MRIELHHIPISELVKKYTDNGENGVFGYNGKLNIRPPYQREFIYKEEQRNAVIDSILNGFPINVMYWNVCGKGKYEIIDGQQRTVSICQFYNGEFSIRFNNNIRYFGTLADLQDKFLNYELSVYFCTGTETERMKWFQTINIAGEELTKQEIRNAIYHGTFTTDAKRMFSKADCRGYDKGKDYLTGSHIRQDYLEKALKWFVKGGDEEVETYMAQHRNDANANELWLYFNSVIEWIETTFHPTDEQKKIMKGVEWGPLYDKYSKSKKKIDLKKVNAEYKKLMLDDDVTKKSGIYPFILTRDPKYLSLREFSKAQKLAAYKRQKGICKKCGKKFGIDDMEADHIKPWSNGGKTTPDNCQLLCKDCNRRKSNK